MDTMIELLNDMDMLLNCKEVKIFYLNSTML